MIPLGPCSSYKPEGCSLVCWWLWCADVLVPMPGLVSFLGRSLSSHNSHRGALLHTLFIYSFLTFCLLESHTFVQNSSTTHWAFAQRIHSHSDSSWSSRCLSRKQNKKKWILKVVSHFNFTWIIKRIPPNFTSNLESQSFHTRITYSVLSSYLSLLNNNLGPSFTLETSWTVLPVLSGLNTDDTLS